MANNPNPSSPLPGVFSPATRNWFLRAFKQPTVVQSGTMATLYANKSEGPTGPASVDVYVVTGDGIFKLVAGVGLEIEKELTDAHSHPSVL